MPREQALLTSTRKDRKVTVQSSGGHKLPSSSEVEPCDTSSEIHPRYCLMRRGLATERSNMLACSSHDSWLAKLMMYIQIGCSFARVSKPTFQQLEAADKRLFLLLA